MQVPEPPKQPGALIDPPRQPGDRVKLAVAEEERQQQDRVVDKPIVKGGDYDDKLGQLFSISTLSYSVCPRDFFGTAPIDTSSF